MAQRPSTIVIDDLTGTELGDDVTCALEGAAYEIDLAPSSAADLREGLWPFIDAARTVGRGGRGFATSSASTGEQTAARARLVEQGVDVPSHGRLSAELLKRYRARSGCGGDGVISVSPNESDRRGRRTALRPQGRAEFDTYLARLEQIVRSARG